METKWTPGPWIFDNNEGYGQNNIWSRMTPTGAGKPGPLVATAVGDSAEAEANAHLIAAAPDLYAALELILPLGKGYVAANNVGNNRAFIADAETALAKARGEA